MPRSDPEAPRPLRGRRRRAASVHGVTYPDAELEVAEIDPGVTQTAVELMGLHPRTRVISYNTDAREVVEAKQGSPPYDLVFGDAFNDFQIPYHLTTREFAQKIRNLLKPDGLYLALVIDRMRGAGSWPPWSGLCGGIPPRLRGRGRRPDDGAPGADLRRGGERDPARSRAARTVRGQGPDGDRGADHAPGRDGGLAAGTDSVVLTDDYAPADNLMAPIFLERDLAPRPIGVGSGRPPSSAALNVQGDAWATAFLRLGGLGPEEAARVSAAAGLCPPGLPRRGRRCTAW